MKYRLLENFRSLSREIIRVVSREKNIILSFDVFDTLIHRRIAPDAIIEAVGREILERLQAGNITPVCSWLDARHQAYAQVAEKFVEQGLDMDAHLDDMVLPWLRCLAGGSFEGDAEMACDFIAREIMFEKWAVYPNPYMLRLLHALKARGVRVVLTSDMYLGEKYVAQLLDQCGYKGLYDRLFVSCDSGTLKRTGQMFAHVAKALRVPPGSILHVGDNLLSDGVMAIRSGMRSFVIRDRVMCARYDSLEYDFQRQKTDPAWKGTCAAAFAQAPLRAIGSPEEGFGLSVMGPVLVPFIHAVAERCKAEGVRKIFFVSREGLILKTIYDEIATLVFGQDAPEAVYFGASRLTTFLAAIQGDSYGLREMASAFSNTGHYSLRNLVQPLQIEEALLKDIAAKAGIADIDCPLPPHFMTWPPMAAFLRDKRFCAIVKERSEAARAGLWGYLEEIDFFQGGRVAFVDVGWGAQIQENLSIAVEGHPKCPQIRGIYLGLNATAHVRKTPNNWMEWVLCDAGHPEYFGQAALEFVFLFEVMTRAPHGTIIGYGDRNTHFAPICKRNDTDSRRTERLDEPQIGAVQQGVHAYARHYARVAKLLNIQANDALPYARSMVARIVRFPSVTEADWLMKLRNISDLGSAETITLGSPALSLRHPRQMVQTLRRAFWPYGMVGATLGKAGQAAVAFKKGKQALPSTQTPLVPWIVWHKEAPSPAHQESAGARAVRVYDFEKQGRAAMVDMGGAGRKACVAVDLHKATRPLRGRDMLASHLVYLALRRWAVRHDRHVPTLSGISLRGLFVRDYGSYRTYNFLRKAVRCAKKLLDV